MKGKHKPGYRPPRTGEKRKTRQPLRIDKLPEEVQKQIVQLRGREGKTWDEIAEITKLPHTTLHRWYDIRVEQANREAEAEKAQSRVAAAKFLEGGFERLPEAVQNALATKVFAVLHARTVDEQLKALKGLGYYALQVQHGQQEERRLELEAAKQRPKDADVRKKLSPKELERKIDEIYGIASDEK